LSASGYSTPIPENLSASQEQPIPEVTITPERGTGTIVKPAATEWAVYSTVTLTPGGGTAVKHVRKKKLGKRSQRKRGEVGKKVVETKGGKIR
jgi:hypothetical protein